MIIYKTHPSLAAYANSRKELPQFSKNQLKIDDHRIFKSNTDKQNADKEVKRDQFHDFRGHDILECKVFSRKTLQERSDWTKKAGLCFRRCFSEEHITKNCEEAVKYHITLFYFNQQNKEEK